MTIDDLNSDSAAMAEFMGWPHVDEAAVIERIGELEWEAEKLRGTLYVNEYGKRPDKPLTAGEATRRRFADYLATLCNSTTTGLNNNWSRFIRECARGIGVVGRSVDEVRAKCIEEMPDIFCTPGGEFAAARQPAEFTLPAPRRVR